MMLIALQVASVVREASARLSLQRASAMRERIRVNGNFEQDALFTPLTHMM